jgi:hypothetical protein
MPVTDFASTLTLSHLAPTITKRGKVADNFQIDASWGFCLEITTFHA